MVYCSSPEDTLLRFHCIEVGRKIHQFYTNPEGKGSPAEFLKSEAKIWFR